MDPAEVADRASGAAAGQRKRPAVTVVMPFAGERAEAAAAAATLTSLAHGPNDELILVDNSGAAQKLAGVTVVGAGAERSPAHARNAGAAAASGEWILFIDADCRPRLDLLERYFAEPVAEDVGALAGEVLSITPDPGGPPAAGPSVLPGRLRRGGLGRAPVAARYGAARSFLSQRQHLDHPYRPRAVAANLLVRRAAFEQVGGFYEGLRAAEDTDFAWRLQQAGWRLELRPHASVEHRYRTTLSELRRQWRGYAAGRAWLARHYEGFVPRPALWRALGRARRSAAAGRAASAHLGRGGASLGAQSAAAVPGPQTVGTTSPAQTATADLGRVERCKYLAIDALLALEELAGFLLSNRPAEDQGEAAPTAGASPHAPHVIFVADRFPSPGDPLIELPSSLGARVEAAGRPQVIPPDAHGLRIDYREDDGVAERLAALFRLFVTHPLRCVRDQRRRGAGEPSLTALAPAVMRLQHEPQARLQPLGGGDAPVVARRLQALAGRRAR